MVEFGLLLVCLALTGYIVMATIGKYNDERIRKERYELEKEKSEKQETNVSKVSENIIKKEEEQPEFISPFELAQDILSGKKNIDEELKDDDKQ